MSNGEQQQLSKATYTLPGVLNFLQQDWRRFEKERNEWQVERSELKSRLAFLEGERRAMEALKSDLVKRVKMLELSLKQERAKNSDKIPESLTLGNADSFINLQQRKGSFGSEVVDATAPASSTRGFSHSKSREMLKNYLKVADSLLAAAKISNQAQEDVGHDQFVPPSNGENRKPMLSKRSFIVENKEVESPAGSSLDKGNLPGNFDSLRSASTIKDRRRSRNSKVAVDKLPPSNRPTSPGEVRSSFQAITISAIEDVDTFTSRRVNGRDESSTGNDKWIADPPLRSHYDTVRAVAFHRQSPTLISGSEDRTVKFWKIAPSSLPTLGNETKLIYTFRGHTSAVTSVAISNLEDVCYSASLDSCILVWKLPSPSQPPYSPHDTTIKLHTLIGHSDAIWDIQPHLTSPLLLSCSADGSLKLWNVEESRYGLKSTFWYNGTSNSSSEYESPTSISWGDNDSIISSYRNSIVKVFNGETRQNTLTLESNSTFDQTSNTQINKVIYHPAMPLIITAHQDGEIRLFDVHTGKVTSSFVAHPGGVSAISLSNDGLTLISGGHDGDLKFWDLTAQNCIQEETVHGGKGIYSIAQHKLYKNLVASAGGDGCCTVYHH